MSRRDKSGAGAPAPETEEERAARLRRKQLTMEPNELSMAIRPAQRAAFIDAHTFFHVHIPKAGGTTLTHGLASIVGWSRTLVRGHNPDVYFPRNLSIATRRQTRLYSAHLRFGMHVYWEAAPLYVSSVRDPLSRYLSYFNFVRRHDSHPGNAEMVEASPRAAFERELEAGQTSALNLQCKRIMGRTDKEAWGVADVIKRIEDDYLLVFPMKRVEEGLNALRRAIDLPPTPTPKLKVSTGERPPTPDMGDFAALNAMDAELTNWVDERFDLNLERAADRLAEGCRAIEIDDEEGAPA